MAEIFSLKADEHKTALELLPWYVNGTLSAEETARVDAHLERCAECREALAFERKLAHEVASLPLNVEDGWNAMAKRMAAQPAEPQSGAQIHYFRRRIPAYWVGASSLAAAAAVAIAFVGVPRAPVSNDSYHALSAPVTAMPGQLVVMFRPNTTEQQMRAVLSAQGARVVDGPTAAGAYVLHVEGSTGGALAALRQSRQVVLAEPITDIPGR